MLMMPRGDENSACTQAVLAVGVANRQNHGDH